MHWPFGGLITQTALGWLGPAVLGFTATPEILGISSCCRSRIASSNVNTDPVLSALSRAGSRNHRRKLLRHG